MPTCRTLCSYPSNLVYPAKVAGVLQIAVNVIQNAVSCKLQANQGHVVVLKFGTCTYSPQSLIPVTESEHGGDSEWQVASNI